LDQRRGDKFALLFGHLRISPEFASAPHGLLYFGDYGLSVGNPADILIFDAADPAKLIAETGQPLMGFKSGRRSFTRAPVRLHDPESEQ
jgi:cytosine deaminase